MSDGDLRQLLHVPGLEKSGANERQLLYKIAMRNGWDPNYLAAAISHESNWNPQAKNPRGSATGLIQFTAATARSLGTTVDQIARMSMFEQLPLVERFYKAMAGARRIDSRDLLVYSIGPAACLEGGLKDACVLYPAGSAGAQANPGLQDQDGAIRVRRMRQALDSIVAAARKREPLDVSIERKWATTGAPGEGSLLSSVARSAKGIGTLVLLVGGTLAVAKLSRYIPRKRK